MDVLDVIRRVAVVGIFSTLDADAPRSARPVCYCTFESRISKTNAAFGLMVPSWLPVAP